MPPYIEALLSPVRDPYAQVAIAAVMALIMLDMIVGVGGAIITKGFSSEKMRAGLLHKFTELVCICLAIILDGALTSGAEGVSLQPILMVTCGYLGVMETGSILELVKKYNPEAEGIVGYLTSFVKAKGGGDNERDGR